MSASFSVAPVQSASRTSASPGVWIQIVFACTIFLSAFLLFLVQPLISKIILPWFGGSTGVWATCMVFFQAMLCLGYGYAHFLQKLPIRIQRSVHWTILVLAIFCLPVMPGEAWKPIDGNTPTLRILTILLLKVGLPYFALSATGPLLQAWHARLFPNSRTYRLYALSNVASLVSLLLFPLWFERALAVRSLSNVWSILFVMFAVACSLVAWFAAQAKSPTATTVDFEATKVESRRSNHGVSAIQCILWLVLPAFASFMLVAGTSHLCQDIASTPFLWILPLCLYLLSFILAFDAAHWYHQRLYVVIGLIGLYGVIAMRDLGETEDLSNGWLANGSLVFLAPIWEAFQWYEPATQNDSTWTTWLASQTQRASFHIGLAGQIAFHCVGLFAIFMVFHGELARRKPAASHLTAFYLMMSIGGALGSAAVSLGAPFVFDGLWEWWFGLSLCVFVLCAMLFQVSLQRSQFSRQSLYTLFALPTLVVVAITLWQNSQAPEALSSRLVSVAPASAQPFVETTDPEEDFFDEDAEFSSNEPVLSSSVFWVLLGILGTAAVFGLMSCFSTKRWAGWASWTVVNIAALGLTGLYLRDTLVFAIPNVFEKPSVLKDLTNKDNSVWRGRNFYGALVIEESSNVRELRHGRIVHGTQYIDGPRRSEPTTYYTENSGVAIAIDHASARTEMHLGAIGLGTGTLASFAKPTWKSLNSFLDPGEREDTVSIYEINPLVVSLSESEKPWFCYVKDARERGAKVNILLGDARLTMERQEPQQFDVLAVDAFSGDSIPVHLLTEQAMAIYERHLKPTGALVIHISNRYLDLEPICKSLAGKFGYEGRVVEDDTGEDGYSSTWVIITRDASLYTMLDENYSGARPFSAKKSIAWTDDFSSLVQVLIREDYDDAVLAIEATSWFQDLVKRLPTFEIEYVPKWKKDGWTYCRVAAFDGGNADIWNVRVKDSKVEMQDADEGGDWQEVQ